MRPPPRRKLAPRWLLRVVRRGLASDPGDRYPSMDALLAQLSADPRRRVRTAIVAVVLVALVADGAFVAFGGGESRQLCSGAEQKWVGIWDAPRARAVQQAFSTTGKPYASAAYNEVSRGLAAYRSGWIAMHTEACEATRVRGDQAEDLLERRMLCLDARLRDARALIDRFTTADAATVERAPLAIGALGDFAPCADAQVLSSELPPPADPATRARVSELRGELAALKAENPTGGARDRMAALVAATAATHYLPLEAEARLEQGVVETAAGDADAAAAAYEQAVWAAEAGRADEIAASAWTGLMESRRAQARNEDALALAPRVTALLARFGGNDEIEGALHTVRASILSDLNRVDEAQAEAERARSVLERRFGAGDLRVAEAFHALAGVAAMAGHQDDARAYYERELAIKRQVFGDDHPAVASVLIDLSFQQSMKGNYLDALATLARARAVYERAVAPEHPALARVAHKLGINYAALGQFDKAVAEFRRAVAIGEVAYGKEHPTYASSVMSLGDALEGLGRYDEALALLHQALSIFERRFGFVHGRVATCLELIARALVAKGRLRDGRAAELRAIELYEQVFGATTTQLRQPLLALGDIDNELGAPARAVAPLERALALGPDTDPAVYAEVQWCLGRALVDSHLDVTRGLALVRTARAQFEKEDRTRAALNAVDTWLRQRGARKVSPARAGGSL
jgi:tetratricopeptide (TPR) repeat protein